MRCNACWRELEGRAVTTTCGHLLCILYAWNKLDFFIYNSCQILDAWWICMISLITSKGPEDANKILSNDGACPICDQVLSKRYSDNVLSSDYKLSKNGELLETSGALTKRWLLFCYDNVIYCGCSANSIYSDYAEMKQFCTLFLFSHD